MDSLMCQLKSLVDQVADGCPPCGPCGPAGKPCGTCPCPVNGFTSAYIDKPFLECCMVTPPPGPLPLYPEPVKPLTLPCPECPKKPPRCFEDDFNSRYSNYYNNYNIDPRSKKSSPPGCPDPNKCKGSTVDGQCPMCEDYRIKKKKCPPPCGCPTGFKPCEMKFTPPCFPCDPCGIWRAEVQPCPPKPKPRVSNKYEPGPCTRPCCKHWKPEGGPCLHGKPCKAQCFNHPIGMKAQTDYC